MEDHHHRSSDDISLFLNQILLRSSSSLSSTTTMTTSPFCSSFMGARAQSFSAVGPGPVSSNQQDNYDDNSSRSCGLNNNVVKGGMLGLDISGDGVVMKNGSAGCFLGNVRAGSAANSVSSLSVGGGGGGCGASENETDDHDCECESEEGLEALVEEVQTKAVPPRSSSKRSRAAEVHNLSEKRRRSRINEKMKALQNLIPNSNKTDKASMLDEAIEYLKQLQLQVQMLSMRNGVGLHPMCLPGLLQPIQFSQFSRGFPEENVSQHTNVTVSLPLNQDIAFNLPNQPAAVSNHPPVPNMSTVISSEASFGMESSLHFGPFGLHTSSEEICREDILPHQQLNADHSERLPTGFEMRATTASLQFEKQASNLKENSSIGARMIQRDHNECLFLKDNLMVSPNLQGMQAGRRDPDDGIKTERREV